MSQNRFKRGMDLVWFALIPAIIVFGYWTFFMEFSITPHAWRILDLPKVFFDQTLYMQTLAKVLYHGLEFFTVPMKPIVWLAQNVSSVFTLSELYALSVILSAVTSLWLMARLLRELGRSSLLQSRLLSLGIFLIVQAILILRPGAPSWYAPFFLLSLILVWWGDHLAQKRIAWSAIVLWIAAAFLASVYPWYFALIATLSGMLFIYHFLRSAQVVPIVIVGVVLTLIAIIFRDTWLPEVLSSHTVALAYYSGIGFNHLIVLSNTMIAIGLWWIVWFLFSRMPATDTK